jgi:hypothetical protein
MINRKISVFWDITSCFSLEMNQRLGRTFGLVLQPSQNMLESKVKAPVCYHFHDWFLSAA